LWLLAVVQVAVETWVVAEVQVVYLQEQPHLIPHSHTQSLLALGVLEMELKEVILFFLL
jgi:hypothetical protein